MKKSNILLTSIVLLTAGSSALTILAISSKESKISNRKNAIRRYEEFNAPFAKYKNTFNLNEQESKELDNETNLAEFTITNPDSTTLQKFIALNRIGNYQLGIISKWANSQLDAGTFDDKMDEFRQLLEGQVNRLREIDLRSQFDNIESINPKYSFAEFSSLSNDAKKEWIKKFNTEFTKKINDQYELISVHLMEPNNTLDDNVVSLIQKYPTLALRNEVMQNVFQIENDLLDRRFRINNIAINKTYIENKLKDASSENTEFLNRYNEVLTEMNNIVNSNFTNVFNNMLSVIPTNYQLTQDLKDEIAILKSNIRKENSALANREIFDKLVNLISNEKIVTKKALDKHLNLKSISNYMSLSDYFNNTSSLKIQASTTTNDLNDALDNLKTFNSMLDSANSTNQQIIDEYLAFVKAFPKTNFEKIEQNLKFDKSFMNLIDTKKIQEIDKNELISTVTNLRNSFNTLRNLEQKFNVAKEHFAKITKQVTNAYPNPLLTQIELDEFNNFVKEIGKKDINVEKLVKEVNNKIDSVSTLIETRFEFRDLASQIKETILNLNDYPEQLKALYLNGNVKQLATDLQNRILSLDIYANLDKDKLVAYKYNVREQLRGLQKIELAFLRSKTIEQLAKLNKNKITDFQQLEQRITEIATVLQSDDLKPLNVNSELLEQKLNELNGRVNKEVSLQFNPIISDKILELIKEYKFIVNALETSIVQDKATLELYKAIQYTYDSFNPTNDTNYLPTEYQINQLKKLTSSNKLLREQNQKTNDLLLQDDAVNNDSNLFNDDFLNSIKSVMDVAKNTQQDVKHIDDVSKIIDKLDKTRKEIESDPDIRNNFAEEFNKIDEIRAKIVEELSNDVIDSDKIEKLSEQATTLLHEINEKRKDGFLNQKLDKIKEAIDKAYPESSTQSPGEDGLRTRWKDLYNQAQRPNLTKEQKNDLLAKADKLSQSVPLVKKLEEKLREYEKDAEKYNSDPDRKTRVPEAILEAKSVKDSINALFIAVGSGDDLPSIDKLDGALHEISNEKAKLDLAYNQDKIESLNERIVAKKYTIDSQSPHALKSELNKAIINLDKYSKQKIASDALPDTVDALEKLNAENDLIDVVKNAINAYDEIKNDKDLDETNSAIEANKLQEIIMENMPNLTVEPKDTVEEIARKKAAIEEAVQIAQAKNKLRKVVVNELPKVLTDAEENRDLLKSIKDSVNEAKAQYQSILDSDNGAYSPEAIDDKRVELENKIAKLIEEKQKLLSKYNKAKSDSEAIRTEYDQKAFIGDGVSAPEGEDFNNYKLARQEYLQDLQNTDKSTPSTIEAAVLAMKKAYNKDVVENAIDKYKKFANDEIKSVTDDEINTVKELTNDFTNYVDAILNSANGIDTEEQALQISKQTQAMKNYNDTQKDVVDAIRKYKELAKENPEDNEITEGIEQLKALLNKNLFPESPFDVETIKSKHKDLIAKITKIKEEIGKRSENKALANELIAHADNFSKLPGESNPDRVVVNDAITEIFGEAKNLGNSVDPEFRILTNKILDDIKNTNADTLDKTTLSKIKNKLDVIDETKKYSDALALMVGSAQILKENNSANTSNIVTSLISKDLNPLIKEAQQLYANSISLDEDKNQESVDRIKNAYIEKIKEIQAAKTRLEQALEIDKLVKDTIAESNSVNYFDLNGVNGESNLQKAKNWLQSISNSATIDSNLTTEQKDEKLSVADAMAQKAKLFIAKQKEISDTIEQWKQQRENQPDDLYANTVKDEQNLIKAMWDNLPQGSENLDADQIQVRLTNIENALTLQTSNRAKRMETTTQIKEFEKSELYSNTTKYPKLLASLKAKVKNLYKENSNADNVTQMEAVQTKLANLKEFIVSQTLLAEKIEEINAYAISITPSTNDIADKKSSLTDEIESSEDMYNEAIPTAQIMEEKKQEIENKIKLLELQKARLNVYVSLGVVKSEIKNDSNINADEREYLERKLKQFTTKLESIHFDENTDPSEFTDLQNQWLSGKTEDSIPYAIQNTKELSSAYREAQKVNNLKQTGLSEQLDSAAVKSAFSKLGEAIEQAVAMNKDDNTTNEAKKLKIAQLQSLTEDVIAKKKESLTQLASNAEQLYKVLNEPTNNAQDAKLEHFKEKAIDDIKNCQLDDQATKAESINKMNQLIQAALDIFRSQVEKAYQVQSDKLDKKLELLQSYTDNILINSIWKQPTADKFTEITAKNNEVNSFTTSKSNISNSLKQYSGIDIQTSFVNAYLNKNIELIKQSQEVVDQFKESINNDFDELLTENTGKLTVLSNIFDKGLVTSSVGSEEQSLFKQIGFIETEANFSTLKTSLASYVAKLQTIKSNSNTAELQINIQEVNNLLTSFGELISTLKNEAEQLSASRANLNEIWQYLLKANKIDSANVISTAYHNKWTPFNEQITSIEMHSATNFISNSFVFDNLNAIDGVIIGAKPFIDYINNVDLNNNFKNLLHNINPEVKDSIIFEDFNKNLDKMTQSLDPQEEKLDITNNDSFLSMFDNFGDTKIDSESNFSPIYFKVYLVKDTSLNKWVVKQSSNISEKVYKAKLRYEYRPDNLNSFSNYSGFSFDVDRELRFKTKDSLSLESGTSSVFFKNYEKSSLGYNSKQVIGNVEELGWDDVTNRELASEKVLETFKKALGIEGNKQLVLYHTRNNDEVLKHVGVVENGQYSERTQGSDNFNINFLFPQFYIYQQSTQISADSELQALNISVQGNEIIIDAAIPSNLLVGPANYEANANAIVVNDGVIDDTKSMPDVILNRIRMGVDFDDATKNVSLFLTHFESFNVTKQRILNDNSITPTLTYEHDNAQAYVWSNIDFAKYMVQHTDIWDNHNSGNESYLAKDVDGGDVSNDYAGYTPTSTDPGYSKYIIKNHRAAYIYIYTTDTNGDNIKNTSTISDDKIGKLSVLYNTGIVEFNFKDLKN
ncbi:hypothetical protein NXS15_00175 [Mycoplasma sp. CSL7475-4]|uniref:hypothetical protein n=1 Tax=Mycoplasma sp. CSL7475-4 TaxID=2973942 RepID=UPI00216B44DC|nr:hypothetical protein [Mycoplasma sp. CSL7475-4]MCS4536549.1 hypothetical protein [Mycoplasma sp. CSL7475-4]